METINKYLAVKYMFPEAEAPEDFRVVDYGEGQVIEGWKVKDADGNPVPMPTEEELRSAWVEYFKKQKIEELGLACQAAINSTFVSSALGTPHVYSYDEEARENLKNAEAAAKYMADDATVEWRIHDTREVKQHTKQQVIQLFLDSVQHVRTNVAKYRQLEAQVLAATTEEEINAITWEVTDGTTTV